MRVLVVEDDKLSQKLIVSILEKNSIEVEAMGSAKAAMDFLKNGELVDVIISDVMMPHIDGFMFTRLLNTDKRLNKIPVILCTALNDKASLVKGIEVGIAGYVIKPVKEAILIPKVKKAAENSPGAVLVVDDEELMRGIIVAFLKRDLYKVMTAKSGNDAIEIIKNNKVAMVISDIAMPEMDGFKLLSYIKEINMSIPVILISGRNEYSRDEIVATGADDFIAKPFHNTEISDKVRAHYK
ncbi:MAG: response regulator [candidate division Zixibacteria bacterium]|nr:response regulator [candidate division Zixibacteria bacterium]